MSNDTLTSWGLADPRMVGATEYAAIYEALADAIDEGDDRAFVLAMLDEFIEHATSMKARLIEDEQAGIRADALKASREATRLPKCVRCGHQCPEDRRCDKCGGDPMEDGDTLCVHCDAKERDKP